MTSSSSSIGRQVEMLSLLNNVIVSPWFLCPMVILFIAYKWGTSTHAFFDGKGVQFRKPLPLLGNMSAVLFRTRTFHEVLLDLYGQFSDKRYFGLFQFRRPLLALRDPELIKQIAVRDFDHFLDHRNMILDADIEPLFGNSLFMLKGQKWRDMRATLSPAFTGSKTRQMFQLVVDCAEETTKMLLTKAAASGTKPYVPELKDLFSRCTTDVIATSAFGIQVNSLKNPTNKFYMTGQKSTTFGLRDLFVAFFMGTFPRLAKALGMQFFDAEQTDFYRSLVHDTMRHRHELNIFRPDMIQLLMEARQKGAIHSDNDVTETSDSFATVQDISAEQLRGQTRRWSDDDLTAQCFLFFTAGFETTATLLATMCHELAENQDVQERLRSEIDSTRAQLNGASFTYDTMQTMRYLDMVVSESLRKWPPAIATDRMCVKPYEFTDVDGNTLRFNKGDGLWIPIFGLHRDPEYYPDPSRFDPERFSDENKANIRPFTFLPFGAGPRNCIGSRFALMSAKIFMFNLMSNFTLEMAENTQVPLRLVQVGFRVSAEKGYNIHMKPRASSLI